MFTSFPLSSDIVIVIVATIVSAIIRVVAATCPEFIVAEKNARAFVNYRGRHKLDSLLIFCGSQLSLKRTKEPVLLKTLVRDI